MSLHAPATPSALDLPPPYSLIVLREAGDAFSHACAIAGEKGAGTLVWVRRYDLAEFAIILEPQEQFIHSRRAIYAGMIALASALATHAPPSRPIVFEWPDAIRVDGLLVGGGRLGWPDGTRDNDTPDWLVFSAMIRTVFVGPDGAGLRPLLGGLEELGFENDASQIITSFARHLMTVFDEWKEVGFLAFCQQWLHQFSPKDQPLRVTENGDLLLSDVSGNSRRRLAEALTSPSWLGSAVDMPWL